jgi:hypothetical protein
MSESSTKTKPFRYPFLFLVSEVQKLGRDAILSRGVLWRLFYCRGNREARGLVDASNMTFQRKDDEAFKQKAVATVLQKRKKSHKIVGSSG